VARGMMTQVNRTTVVAVVTAAPTRDGSLSGARICDRATTIGSGATQITTAIFHFGGGCTGAGLSGSVNHVSNPDRTCGTSSAVLTASASRIKAAYRDEVCQRSSAREAKQNHVRTTVSGEYGAPLMSGRSTGFLNEAPGPTKDPLDADDLELA
jgi:hypothetical protein